MTEMRVVYWTRSGTGPGPSALVTVAPEHQPEAMHIVGVGSAHDGLVERFADDLRDHASLASDLYGMATEQGSRMAVEKPPEENGEYTAQDHDR